MRVSIDAGHFNNPGNENTNTVVKQASYEYNKKLTKIYKVIYLYFQR